MTFRSNNLLVKWIFGQTTLCAIFFSVKWHFSKKAFGQMNFWSNDLSVKWTFGQKNFRSNIFSVKRSCAQFFFGQMTFFVESRFSQMTIFWKKSVIRPFSKMNFRSNSVRLNSDSAEWTFVQMASGQTVFGQMVFRSKGLSVIFFRWNDFSVKWSRTSATIFFEEIF
jgi:hypothetical protein